MLEFDRLPMRWVLVDILLFFLVSKMQTNQVKATLFFFNLYLCLYPIKYANSINRSVKYILVVYSSWFEVSELPASSFYEHDIAYFLHALGNFLVNSYS